MQRIRERDGVRARFYDLAEMLRFSITAACNDRNFYGTRDLANEIQIKAPTRAFRINGGHKHLAGPQIHGLTRPLDS